MPVFKSAILSPFNRTPSEPCLVARAEHLIDVRRAGAAPEVTSILPRGAGLSLSDTCLNRDGGVLLTERLDRILAFDPATGVVECEAGCTIDRLIQTFLPRGFFPFVTPGTRYVTIGGSIGSDVHGKNHHADGSFASCVVDFKLQLADGSVIVCSREENSGLFWSTIGGCGLTGVILSARLRMLPISSSYVRASYKQTRNLDETFEQFAAGETRRYSVAWLDCLATGQRLGRAVMMHGDHAAADELPASIEIEKRLSPVAERRFTIPFNVPSVVMNSWSVNAFNSRFYNKHSDGEAFVRYDKYFHPLDKITNYGRMYGKRGFVQFQCVIPFESSRAGMRILIDKLVAARCASFLAVLKTTGPANDAPLSFPMAGHTLALDIPNYGEKLTRLLREMLSVVVDHGGRTYLAKDSVVDAATFRRMYPRVDEFLAVKRKVDPTNRFQSSLGRRLGLDAT